MINDDYQSIIPTVGELTGAGAKIRKGTDPLSRGHDILERYLNVPNHAMFLFTSEDSLIDRYIRDHWAALDGLSGEVCDIHVSLLQLQGGEDAYSQFKDVRSIPGLSNISASDLPALHIWSNICSVTLPLRRYDQEADLKGILRAIFTLMHDAGGAVRQNACDQMAFLVTQPRKDYPNGHTMMHQEVYMDAKYKILGGNQGNVGDDGEAHDFSQISSTTAEGIDLKALATELATLRTDLSKAATEPEHFQAMSEVNEAEKAAKAGDGTNALEHLKKAGKWVFDVATGVGIGLATEAAKTALGF